MDSEYNLYTIDETGFKEWVKKTITDEAQAKLVKYVREKCAKSEKIGEIPDDELVLNYLWDNILTMRNDAEPTPNAHGRGDMPQTDKVSGEYMKPKAAPVSESIRRIAATKFQYQNSEFLNKKYGKLTKFSESRNLYKTDKGVVLQLL